MSNRSHGRPNSYVTRPRRRAVGSMFFWAWNFPVKKSAGLTVKDQSWMRFFQFEQHMADTAHKKRLQKLEAFSKQTFSFHFQTFFSNIFFNILDLILQIASISSVRCFSHRNSSPKPMGTKITIRRYLEAVSPEKRPAQQEFPCLKIYVALFPFSLFFAP